jgi:Protein similar to CwfJ C-terminus 1
VKTHLIASVAESAYVAMPRGGMHCHHVLIIPIACVPSRVHMSPAAKVDLQKYEFALQSMFQENDCVSLRFERSLRTKGKDHMQVQIIPVSVSRLSETIKIFMQTATFYKLKFSEIADSDGEVDEVVVNMEGGPFQEYFYIEIPIGDSCDSVRYKRFVYVHADQSTKFPMHFGIEVIVTDICCTKSL